MTSDTEHSNKCGKHIGELLIESGIISSIELPASLEYAQKTALPLGRVLVLLRCLTEQKLQSALHAQTLIKIDNLPVQLATRALALSSKQNIDIDEALNQLGWQAAQNKDYSHALAIASDELAVAEAALGGNDPEVANHCLKVADLYFDNGNYEQAEMLYSRALAVFEKTYGSLHVLVTDALQRLANVYFASNKYKEAEPLYWRVFEIKQRVLGQEHPEVAESLADLAELYEMQSQYLEAEHYCLSSGDRSSDPAELLSSLRKLAFVCKQQTRRYEKKDISVIGSRLLEPKLLDTSLAVAEDYNLPIGRALISLLQLNEQDLQNVMEAQLKVKEGILPAYVAIKAIRKASEKHGSFEEALINTGWQLNQVIHEQNITCVEQEPSIGNGKNLLMSAEYLSQAQQYVTDKKFEEAEALLKQALVVLETAPHSQLDLANVKIKLAEIYMQQNKFETAELLYLSALDIKENLLGCKHRELAVILENLGQLRCICHKDYKEAGRLYQLALGMNEDLLGSDDSALITSLMGRANCYCQQGRYELAERLYLRAMRIKGKTFSPEDPEVATIFGSLGDLYCLQGHLDKAELQYEFALKILEPAFGCESPHVATVQLKLADCYSQQGNYSKAETFYQQALKTRETVLGPENEETAQVLALYAKLLRAVDRAAEADGLENRAKNIQQMLCCES